MSLFSARELADLRALSESAMADSGIILRTILLDDGAGGQYPDPAGPQEIGPILGRFRQLSGAEQIRAAQLGQLGAYRWFVPASTDMRVTDQVRLLGAIYAVVWAPPPAALDADRVVGLEEATP